MHVLQSTSSILIMGVLRSTGYACGRASERRRSPLGALSPDLEDFGNRLTCRYIFIAWTHFHCIRAVQLGGI